MCYFKSMVLGTNDLYTSCIKERCALHHGSDDSDKPAVIWGSAFITNIS